MNEILKYPKWGYPLSPISLQKGSSTPPRSRECWGLQESFPVSFLDPCAQAQ